MKKTRFKTTIVTFVMLSLMLTCVSLSFADDAADARIAAAMKSFDKKELVGLIDDLSKEDVFEHAEWQSRNPFDTAPIQDLLGAKPSTSTGPVLKVSSVSGFELQGIFLGGYKPSAIINNTVVGVGDEIKNATVKEIKDNTVVLVDSTEAEIILQIKK